MASDAGKLAEARARMATTARGLAQVLGAMDAASVLAGAAVAVLEAEGGPALAARYLRELADEVQRTPPPDAARNN